LKILKKVRRNPSRPLLKSRRKRLKKICPSLNIRKRPSQSTKKSRTRRRVLRPTNKKKTPLASSLPMNMVPLLKRLLAKRTDLLRFPLQTLLLQLRTTTWM